MIKLYLFYEEKSVPDVQNINEKDADVDFYIKGLLHYGLIIGDKKGRFPFLVVAYLNSRFYAFSTVKNKQTQKKLGGE